MEYLSDAWEALIHNYGENEARKEFEAILLKLGYMKVEFAAKHEMDKVEFIQEIIDKLKGL
jgi:hypothetical protein